MNAFDRLCAMMAFLLGIVLLTLGAIGLFAGCSAHFTLPPVLGVLPAFVGWGVVRAVYVAWNDRRDWDEQYSDEDVPLETPYED
ncbi:hypothetical protein Mal4_38260 [Maioricimonas rarisocia]|uniref:Uncharacterized protein n=1 Tax=Maioricimonas rarisocia TaxID=2528026 RepID=A0A517ZAM9_9PLAN|nr:hypothetical protein [Maioricimonas rarisocia]QDU39481.1 hypothetical protein Mal4_38260 [Maioricimonas rarisocia]